MKLGYACVGVAAAAGILLLTRDLRPGEIFAFLTLVLTVVTFVYAVAYNRTVPPERKP